MSLDFTVAIPVYNGAHRVPQVLERLRSQIDTATLTWEILVIDNNSQDNLAEVMQTIQLTWNHAFPIRYFHEPRQGVAFARSCAVKEAEGKYIGFLDDDNLAASNWVRAAYDFGEQHPKAGAYGGKIQILANFPLPKSFNRVKGFLAIRDLGPNPQKAMPQQLQLPPGAGLVVRKEAWLASVPQTMVRTGRAGDDYEISLHMHNSGWDIWYNPAMVLDHHIPPHRLETSYLSPLAYLYGLCTCELQMIVTASWQQPFVLGRSFLGSLKRLIIHAIRYKHKIFTDLAARCQMAFFWGSLLSPGFYLRNATQRGWQRFWQRFFPVPQGKLKTDSRVISNSG